MLEPQWLAVARSYLGTREIPGKDSAPEIVKMLATLKAWWSDDSTPWCGVFAAYCFKVSLMEYPKEYYRALKWKEFGIALDRPTYGCIVVFNREGGGHVGFVVGQDDRGRLMVLGGNQGDKVSIAPFDRSRVAAYRYPNCDFEIDYALPLLKTTAQSSTREA